MKTLKLFALALAFAGLVASEADAGGRRGRRCRDNGCNTSVRCTPASTCSSGSCGTVVSSTPAESKPAATVTPSTTVVPASQVIYSSGCSNGRCGRR